jgi:hypothetical protein
LAGRKSGKFLNLRFVSLYLNERVETSHNARDLQIPILGGFKRRQVRENPCVFFYWGNV